MSAVTAYRALLRIVGPAYIFVAFLGRIPLAMSQLGVLVLISSETGSYGLGGAAAGVLAVANAIGSPIAGTLADRLGQRPVVLVQSLLGAAGLITIVLVAGPDASRPLLFAASAFAGVAMPQVGPLARVRWRPLTTRESDQRRLIDAAFSYEGAADEASFVLGPALIGVLAIVANPSGALVAGAAMLAVFGSWFALHPTASVVERHRAGDVRPEGRLWTTAFVALFLAQLCVGSVFGSIQTGTTALTRSDGHGDIAGLIHACLGVGSVTAGLAVAALPATLLYSTRMVASATALTALSLPLLLVDSILGLILAVLALGFAVAPYMISNFALAGILVPAHRVGAAMTFLAGATGSGYALGAAIAGRLADEGGHQPALAVTVCSAVAALVVALAANKVLRFARPSEPNERSE